MDERLLVLCVEDDPDLSLLVADALEAEGFVVATAPHGRAALALLESGLRPAVVVTDLMMPVLDGFGFLAGYARRPGPRAPVLAVSAFEPYLELAGPAGAAATLRKPYPLASLVATVRQLAAGAPQPPPPAPPPTTDDRARLEAVLRLRLDEPAPSEALREFTERVARVFDVPICLVSVVTLDRQSWHAHCGLPPDLAATRGNAREDSFCTHAVAARAALVVQDTAENPFFRGNVLVRERGLRFYAGVPLVTRGGPVVGTLCLLDFAPRGFGWFDLELLGTLARRVVAELEWREKRVLRAAPHAAFCHLDDVDPELDVLGRTAFQEVLRIEALRAAEHGWPLAVGVAACHDLPGAVRALKRALPGAHLGRLGLARFGIAAPRMDGASLAAALHATTPGERVTVEDRIAPGGSAAVLQRLESAQGAPPAPGPASSAPA